MLVDQGLSGGACNRMPEPSKGCVQRVYWRLPGALRSFAGSNPKSSQSRWLLLFEIDKAWSAKCTEEHFLELSPSLTWPSTSFQRKKPRVSNATVKT